MKKICLFLLFNFLSGCLYRQDDESALQLAKKYSSRYKYEYFFYSSDFETVWYCFPPAPKLSRAELGLLIINAVYSERAVWLKPEGRICVFVSSRTNDLAGISTSMLSNELEDQISSSDTKMRLLEKCGQWQWDVARRPDTNDIAQCQGVELNDLMKMEFEGIH